MAGSEKRKARLHQFQRFNLFDLLNYTFLAVFGLISLYPLIYVLAGSFSEGLDYTSGGIYFLPRIWSFENYLVILNDHRLWIAYKNTVLRTLIGVPLALIFTSLVAYAMSRKELIGRPFFYWASIATMFFGGGLIPYFLVIKMLGLYDNFLVYVIPGMYSAFNMIIFSSFFRSIPEEIRESAVVDGAEEIYIWYKIIIPLSKPVLATVGLWLTVGSWNSFFDTMVFTVNPDLQTLQYYLLKVIHESSMPISSDVPLPPQIFNNISPQTVSLAAIIIATIPILFVYPFLQKYFVKGIMIGSLKG
jgi:putative aldouronate transport system permease protein